MKIISRKLSLSVAVTAAASVILAGCGGGDAATAPGGAAGSKENVTLKMLVPNNVEEFPAGSDINNNEIASAIREKTGFNVQWELLPKDSEAVRQKLNVIMASGEAPDIIIINDRQTFGSFVQQGLLTPLDDLLNDVGKDIKAMVTPEQLRTSTAEDGKVYAVRSLTFNIASRGLLARKDLLDELGIQEPKTQDEFYEALRTIKAKKPDTVPYSANLAQGLSSLQVIQSMFYPPVDYLQKNGKVVYPAVEPEAKQFLTFANKLFTEGLLDKESVVNKIDNLKEKFVSGKVAMSTVGWSDAKAIDDAIKTKNPNAKMIYMEPPTGSNGAFGLYKAPSLVRYIVIPKSSKHAKEAIQFLNKAANKEIIDFISFGFEGKHFEKKDGKVVPTPEAQKIRFAVYYNMFDTVEHGMQRLQIKGWIPYFVPLTKYAKYEDVLELVSPIEAVDKKAKELFDLRDEYFLKMITGALPLSAFDEYVAKWKKAGGEDVVKAMNDVYNGKK
ncbi:extracellular solute-binding protein [Paenibacillus piri]|uniref:Extracellular solute-binding protein n=1 Tax=Paenibacillus piri TaxID=2547395 RepID=A0A4V2ZTX7_9BACL|nr:extracellular solute-binding protein [Paenibacillus piri]TDF98814.1 extracellular solute-binding protein [Paenibacillus piri]